MTHDRRSPRPRARSPRARDRHDKPGASTSTAGRHAAGTFAPGNTAALTHGTRSRHVRAAALPAQAAVQATLAARRTAIVADLGGDAGLSQLQQDLVDRYLELDTVATWLGGHLVAEGPLTARGRTRAALAPYVTVVDRVQRVATALDLARRPRAVSLDAYVGTHYPTTRHGLHGETEEAADGETQESS